MRDKQIWLQVNIECKDWSAIRNEETKDAYEKYKNDLGLFVCVCNVVPNITSITNINI